MEIINNPELSLRHTKIQTALINSGADACLISTVVNILYVAGEILSGYCYIPVEGKPLFFIRRPVGIEGENIYYIRKPEHIVDLLQKMGLPLPKHLLLEAGEMTHLDFLRLEATFQSEIIGDCTSLLRQVRAVKTPHEIDLLKQTARLQSEVFTEIPKLYRKEMKDYELGIAFQNALLERGFMFNMRVFGSSMEGGVSCVLAGDNAGTPSPYDFSLGGAGTPIFPVGQNGTVLKEGMSVMVDSGSTINGYLSDQTRTFSVGKLPQKAYDIHQVSLEIQDTLSKLCKPGAVCEDLYRATLQVVEKHNLSSCFMGTKQQAPFVGHGLGLVINELPILCDRNKSVIEANMSIAIEPKFVIPGVGAVGTENTYIVRDYGLEKITTAPEEIIEL